jgi:hypothetical protein
MARVTATEDYGTARAVKDAEAFVDDPFLIISERETLSTLVHKYGDVFCGRTESRSPFDALRTGPSRRPYGPPQGERDL